MTKDKSTLPLGLGSRSGNEVKKGNSGTSGKDTVQASSDRESAPGESSSSSSNPVTASSGHGEETKTNPVTASSGHGKDTPATASSGQGEKNSLKEARKAQREIKANQTKVLHERIVRSLWPTSELRKDFRETSGQEPDPVKLLTSVRFRDMWKEFDSATYPTTKARTDLRKLALQIQSKEKRKGNSKALKAKSEDDNNVNKRKLRSLSSERSEPTPTTSRSLPKIPRVGASPAAPATASQVAAPAQSDEEQEILEEEPLLDDFEEDLREALPSFAEKVKGGKRKDFPFILFIHTGDEERRVMSRETFNLLQEKIQEKCFLLMEKGEPAPMVEWFAFAKGSGVIAPANQESQDILRTIVAETKVAEFTFRAWAKGEKGKYLPLSIKLPGSLTFPGNRIMMTLIQFNRLPPDSYVIRSCKPITDNGKERLLRIGAEESLFNAIKAKEGYLYVAACKLEVFYQGSRVTSKTVV